MKTAKKLLAAFLAVMAVTALSATALAAETFRITFADPGFSLLAANDARTYSVYQIFTGDIDETTGRLSNIKWGQNGTGTVGTAVDQTVLDALVAVNSKSDTEKLDEIKKYVNLSSTPVTVSGTTNVTAGYYLFKDNSTLGVGEEYSLYVVEVTSDVTISPKAGTTTAEKKVQDKNDTTGDTAWGDSADYDIGDTVPFQLSATITQYFANYFTYPLTFHDTLATGLTFDSSSVEVYVDDTKIDSSKYTVVTNPTENCTFEVQFDDLTDIGEVSAGSTIKVTYNATLNDQAVVGSAGNSNTMYVTYSNDPNGGTSVGQTATDVVKVYTYKVIVNKVDENSTPLDGAGFTLYKKDNTGTYNQVGTPITTGTTFTFSGLDDGDYKLVESTTPSGYNTVEDIEFTISATHSDTAITTLSATGGATFTSDMNAGSLTTDVVNKSGSLLPETGGIGTTIFYVLGAILVVGAVVLLVTRKRMHDAD